jgi:hypothetical protein
MGPDTAPRVSHQVVRTRRKVLAALHADVNDPPGQLTRPTGGSLIERVGDRARSGRET